MKSIFNPGNYPKNINIALLLLRVTAGTFILTHGVGKVSRLLGEDPIQFTDFLGLGPTVSLSLAAFAEAFCSALLILGAGTRLALVHLIITMSVAAFLVHATDPFAKKELALLYLLIFLSLAITGAGIYSADNRIFRKINSKK